ncbi:MAG: DsbA family oxidoreductase [Candidatus Dormibacteraceae bacterium]
MKVDIWSDVVCPWCYIGKRRFESALADFAHRDQVQVRWRSFELDPTTQDRGQEDLTGRLARKYGISREQAGTMNSRVSTAAAAEGLQYRLDIARPTNTLDAHQLLHLAAEHGLQDQLKERLMAAYFTQGAALNDRETLLQLAEEVGLDRTAAAAALDQEAFVSAVREDETEAAQLGISGVPFFVLDGRLGVSGAQPPALFLEALDAAWKEANPPPALNTIGGQGPNCEDGSCEIA